MCGSLADVDKVGHYNAAWPAGRGGQRQWRPADPGLLQRAGLKPAWWRAMMSISASREGRDSSSLRRKRFSCAWWVSSADGVLGSDDHEGVVGSVRAAPVDEPCVFPWTPGAPTGFLGGTSVDGEEQVRKHRTPHGKRIPERPASQIMEPVISAGMSGVTRMRAMLTSSASCSHESVLATPGTPRSRACPPATSPTMSR